MKQVSPLPKKLQLNKSMAMNLALPYLFTVLIVLESQHVSNEIAVAFLYFAVVSVLKNMFETEYCEDIVMTALTGVYAASCVLCAYVLGVLNGESIALWPKVYPLEAIISYCSASKYVAVFVIAAYMCCVVKKPINTARLNETGENGALTEDNNDSTAAESLYPVLVIICSFVVVNFATVEREVMSFVTLLACIAFCGYVTKVRALYVPLVKGLLICALAAFSCISLPLFTNYKLFNGYIEITASLFANLVMLLPTLSSPIQSATLLPKVTKCRYEFLAVVQIALNKFILAYFFGSYSTISRSAVVTVCSLSFLMGYWSRIRMLYLPSIIIQSVITAVTGFLTVIYFLSRYSTLVEAVMSAHFGIDRSECTMFYSTLFFTITACSWGITNIVYLLYDAKSGEKQESIAVPAEKGNVKSVQSLIVAARATESNVVMDKPIDRNIQAKMEEIAKLNFNLALKAAISTAKPEVVKEEPIVTPPVQKHTNKHNKVEKLKKKNTLRKATGSKNLGENHKIDAEKELANTDWDVVAPVRFW